CAYAMPERHRTPSPPTNADAIDLDLVLIGLPYSPATRSALRSGRADGELDVFGQRRVRDLVGDLDFQTVLAFREARQRNRLTALQLMAGGQVELRWQRLRI